MTFFKTSVTAVALTFCLGTAAAFAQAATPATPAPAAAPAMAAPMTKDQKAAISKACYGAADTQKLHGKARKKFHSDCVKAGGPPKA